MTKFNIEEKEKGSRLVKQGLSLGEEARQTGISPQVIRHFMRQADRHGLSSLREHRYDWGVEERLAVLQYMESNRLRYPDIASVNS